LEPGKEIEMVVEVEATREVLKKEKEEEEVGGKEISEERQLKVKTLQALYNENMQLDEEQKVEGEMEKSHTEEKKQGSTIIEEKEEGNTEMFRARETLEETADEHHASQGGARQ